MYRCLNAAWGRCCHGGPPRATKRLLKRVLATESLDATPWREPVQFRSRVVASVDLTVLKCVCVEDAGRALSKPHRGMGQRFNADARRRRPLFQ